MLCKECKLKAICVHYKDLIKLFEVTNANVSLGKCKYFLEELTVERHEASFNQELKAMPTEEPTLAPNARIGFPDFNQKQESEEFVLEILANCPNCDGQTYNTDIAPCDVCGTKICSGCATETNGKRLCEKCWEES